MISNKTAAVLFLIITNMKLVASTAPSDSQKSGSPGTLVSRKRKQRPASKSGKNVLKDATSKTEDVEAIRESVGAMNIQQEQPGPQVNKKFKDLIKRGEYEEIAKLGETMSKAEFSIQVRLFVKTLDQYNGVVKQSKHHGMVPAFFVYGDIDVVREVITTELAVYGDGYRLHRNNLESAVSIAFKIDRHDRMIELLAIGQKAIPGKIGGTDMRSDFGTFLTALFPKIDQQREGTLLKRFLTFKGEEFRSKNPNLYDIFCLQLVNYLTTSNRHGNPLEFLVDLVGQPSLLTPKIFATGFFEDDFVNDNRHSNFIKCAWAEAIEEGLKEEYPTGGRELWNFMTEKFPERFSGPFPDTDESRKAVGKKFPTKDQLEEEWAKENAPDFLRRLEEFIADIFPSVLVKLIFEYAKPHPTLLDDQRIKTLQTSLILPTLPLGLELIYEQLIPKISNPYKMSSLIS